MSLRMCEVFSDMGGFSGELVRSSEITHYHRNRRKISIGLAVPSSTGELKKATQVNIAKRIASHLREKMSCDEVIVWWS